MSSSSSSSSPSSSPSSASRTSNVPPSGNDTAVMEHILESVEEARKESPDTASAVLYSLVFPDHVATFSTWKADSLRKLYRLLFSGYADYAGVPTGNGSTQKMRDEIIHWLDTSPEAVQYYEQQRRNSAHDDNESKGNANVPVHDDDHADDIDEEEDEEEFHEDEQKMVNDAPRRSARVSSSSISRPPISSAGTVLPPPPRSRVAPSSPLPKKQHGNGNVNGNGRINVPPVSSVSNTPARRSASNRVREANLHYASEELSESEVAEDEDEDWENDETQHVHNTFEQLPSVSHSKSKHAGKAKKKGKHKSVAIAPPSPLKKKVKKSNAFSLHDVPDYAAHDSSSSSSDESDTDVHVGYNDLNARLSAHAHPKPIAAYIFKRVNGLFYKTFNETVKFEKEGNKQQCLALCYIIDQMIREGLGTNSLAVEMAVRRLIGVQSADLSGDWNYCSELEIQGNSQSFLPGDMLKHIITRTSRLYALQQKQSTNSYGAANKKNTYGNKPSFGKPAVKSGNVTFTKNGASSSTSASNRFGQSNKESSNKQ